LVDAEPFQAALSKWHVLSANRAEPPTPNESTIAHLSTMVAFVVVVRPTRRCD